LALLLAILLPLATTSAQAKHGWRAATPAELQAVLPDRAQVEKERIETEMRSATGVIDNKGHVVAAVVLITAGYAANGKYSHYLLVQTHMRVGEVDLAPGSYVLGWTRETDGLLVHFYQAETGVERGTALAKLPEKPVPVIPLRIWPPGERSVIQIGRFLMTYDLKD
jgi:hypothetical protein